MARPTTLLRFAIFAAALAAVPLFAATPTTRKISPPTQPSTGPGGSTYAHRTVVTHAYGQYATKYWIFEPADPTPASAPLIIFCHGWSAMSPDIYGAWITHLVRRGNVVVYPIYQDSLFTPMDAFTPNAIKSLQAAMTQLDDGSHVKTERNHVAIVGHSMGGALAASLAASAKRDGLPQPIAICSVEPQNKSNPKLFMPLADLSLVPAGTLVQVIIGHDDSVAGSATGREIFAGLTSVAAADKTFMELLSDAHGTPAMMANHLAPIAPAPLPGVVDAFAGRQPGSNLSVNAVDWFGIWKPFDALCDAAFNGRNRDAALGNTPAQRYMGKWSDGAAVREMTVTDHPAPPDATGDVRHSEKNNQTKTHIARHPPRQHANRANRRWTRFRHPEFFARMCKKTVI